MSACTAFQGAEKKSVSTHIRNDSKMIFWDWVSRITSSIFVERISPCMGFRMLRKTWSARIFEMIANFVLLESSIFNNHIEHFLCKKNFCLPRILFVQVFSVYRKILAQTFKIIENWSSQTPSFSKMRLNLFCVILMKVFSMLRKNAEHVYSNSKFIFLDDAIFPGSPEAYFVWEACLSVLAFSRIRKNGQRCRNDSFFLTIKLSSIILNMFWAEIMSIFLGARRGTPIWNHSGLIFSDNVML